MLSYRSRSLLLGLQTLNTVLRSTNVYLLLKYFNKGNTLFFRRGNFYVPLGPLRSRNLLVDENRRTLYGYNEPSLAMTRQFNTWSHHFDFNVTTNAFKENNLSISNFGDTGFRQMLGE